MFLGRDSDVTLTLLLITIFDLSKLNKEKMGFPSLQMGK